MNLREVGYVLEAMKEHCRGKIPLSSTILSSVLKGIELDLTNVSTKLIELSQRNSIFKAALACRLEQTLVSCSSQDHITLTNSSSTISDWCGLNRGMKGVQLIYAGSFELGGKFSITMSGLVKLARYATSSVFLRRFQYQCRTAHCRVNHQIS
jgi:hypothetical protein